MSLIPYYILVSWLNTHKSMARNYPTWGNQVHVISYSLALALNNAKKVSTTPLALNIYLMGKLIKLG